MYKSRGANPLQLFKHPTLMMQGKCCVTCATVHVVLSEVVGARHTGITAPGGHRRLAYTLARLGITLSDGTHHTGQITVAIWSTHYSSGQKLIVCSMIVCFNSYTCYILKTTYKQNVDRFNQHQQFYSIFYSFNV